MEHNIFQMNGEGVELPPEHTLTIPILFQPVSTGKVIPINISQCPYVKYKILLLDSN